MDGWGWRARVETESGAVLGAGFLVSSDHVLTCAHVVKGQVRARVTFPGADGAAAAADVVPCGAWAGVDDEGDVAVLRLDAPVGIKPARFAAGDALRGRSKTELGAYGFPRNKEHSGSVVSLSTRPDMDLRQEWWQLDVPAAHLESLKHGFSGAAVYLVDTGEVVGMVTDTDRTVDGRSGRMLPLRSIRRHWEDIDDYLELGWLTAPDRRRLREIVRDAACAIPLSDVYRAAFPGFPEVRRFRSAWDAIRYVAEEILEPDGLPRFLVALSRHVDDNVRRRLLEWLGRAPGTHGARGAGPAGAAPTSVIVRVDRMTRGDVYELSVFTLVDGVPGPYRGPIEVRRDELRDRVEEVLPEMYGMLQGRDWIIEFALPVSLFNEPFETWYLEKDTGIFMRSYPVVVRDVQRMNPRSIRRDLTWKRWRRLRRRGTTLPHRVDCRVAYTDEQFQDWLDAEAECCVLAYAAAPARGRLNAALNAGIPVMLWPRRACADETHGDDCGGGRTLRALVAAITDDDPDRVPTTVMNLRKQARAPQADEHHPGRELALLWDDPARLPDPPLAMGI
jgi:hypothetical protein